MSEREVRYKLGAVQTVAAETFGRPGRRTFRLVAEAGRAQSFIWLEKERICFVGDTIWTDQHPYMAQANSEEWLEALKLIRSLDPEVIVPGHGEPLQGLERIRLMEDYIQSLRQQVAECLAAGKDKNETKKELVKDLMDRFTVPNARRSKIESQIGSGINRVYRELQRAAQVQA